MNEFTSKSNNQQYNNQQENIHNLIIIGSGPAGYSAAIYAARAALDPIMITGMQPGGQLTITTDVENYPGFGEVIQGPFLMKEMEKQAKSVGTEIIIDHVSEVDFSNDIKKITTSLGKIYFAKSIIISTGASAKWLGLKSENKFQGFGVSGCATCDGFFYRDKIVAVVGGGNTAAEEALYLTNHAKQVYLIHRRDEMRAEKILQQRLLNNKKIIPVWNHIVTEIQGQEIPVKSVEAVEIKNTLTQEKQIVKIDGIFIAIGHKPNTDIFKNHINMDDEGYIIRDNHINMQTSQEGVFAAGDVQDKIYRQAVTAAGAGCMAALDVQKFLASKYE
ncbi:MAG TPA: thioredoxin-disulfide reductase [Candidatus Megaira endosymbiont of Hartmannula sinica]|nr:thioredoxin-disulfide reductase [Candidatus Megaera endosymbiont of Hartmannula sinica]